MTLGEKLRIARESANLTQEELGKLCKTTKQTIYKYETGKITNIPLDRLEMIASALGTSAASLMGWDAKEIKPTVPDGLSDTQLTLIQFAEALSDEQAAQALRVLKAIMGDDQ